MKAVLLHVRHVQKPVIPVLNIAKAILEWNNAKSSAGHAPMRAANVRKHAEAGVQMQHNRHKNVRMPAVSVPKNAKSTIMSIVKDVPKNADGVKLNAETFRSKP